MLRNRTSRLGAAMAAALLSFSLAAPAFAEHDDDDWREGRRGYTVHRHGDHCDHDRDRDWDRRRYGDRWRGGYSDWERGRHARYYDGGNRHYAHEYGCRPCGKRWRSQDKFHRHLTRHHHVPYHAIPRVVVFADWGWLFRG